MVDVPTEKSNGILSPRNNDLAVAAEFIWLECLEPFVLLAELPIIYLMSCEV